MFVELLGWNPGLNLLFCSFNLLIIRFSLGIIESYLLLVVFFVHIECLDSLMLGSCSLSTVLISLALEAKDWLSMVDLKLLNML